jgi:hypothetical protein
VHRTFHQRSRLPLRDIKQKTSSVQAIGPLDTANQMLFELVCFIRLICSQLSRFKVYNICYTSVCILFVEGYHNRLADISGRHKPCLWVFIRIIKDEERFVKRAARRARQGYAGPSRKRKHRLLERRIQPIKQQYSRGQKSLSEYWAAVTQVVGRFR